MTPLTEPLTFELPGQPQGKGRARAFRRGDHVGHYTPEKTRSYEGMIRAAAYQKMAGREPTKEPVEITLTAIFDVPKSYSKKKKYAALNGMIRPTKKPDLDNIVKAFVDGCNKIVFQDDCQIVREVSAKVYGAAPRVVVTITPVMEMGL